MIASRFSQVWCASNDHDERHHRFPWYFEGLRPRSVRLHTTIRGSGP